MYAESVQLRVNIMLHQTDRQTILPEVKCHLERKPFQCFCVSLFHSHVGDFINASRCHQSGIAYYDSVTD